MASVKGPGQPQQHDGSKLRVAIVHARWNARIVDALVAGARKSLSAAGVLDANIVVQNVPGSFELPFAVHSIISAPSLTFNKTPFDVVIAIGVLIKGETMHFEYIADAVTSALMRLQMETSLPVIFGLLTVLNEEQALQRAGLGSAEGEGNRGHCHGEDWGAVAVEMGVKTSAWEDGRLT